MEYQYDRRMHPYAALTYEYAFKADAKGHAQDRYGTLVLNEADLEGSTGIASLDGRIRTTPIPLTSPLVSMPTLGSAKAITHKPTRVGSSKKIRPYRLLIRTVKELFEEPDGRFIRPANKEGRGIS